MNNNPIESKTKNKIRNITKIAIELLLLIFGVFVGLQVDKNYENSKIRDSQKALLQDFEAVLKITKNGLRKDLDFTIWTILELEKLRNAIELNSNMDQSLINSFQVISEWKTPYIPTACYVSLQSTGLSLIQNHDLKEKLISLYDITFEYLKNDYDKIENQYSQNIVMPQLIKTMRPTENNFIIPNNFLVLKKNTEFYMMLHYLISLRKKGKQAMEKTIEEIDNVIYLLNNE